MIRIIHFLLLLALSTSAIAKPPTDPYGYDGDGAGNGERLHGGPPSDPDKPAKDAPKDAPKDPTELTTDEKAKLEAVKVAKAKEKKDADDASEKLLGTDPTVATDVKPDEIADALKGIKDATKRWSDELAEIKERETAGKADPGDSVRKKDLTEFLDKAGKRRGALTQRDTDLRYRADQAAAKETKDKVAAKLDDLLTRVNDVFKTKTVQETVVVAAPKAGVSADGKTFTTQNGSAFKLTATANDGDNPGGTVKYYTNGSDTSRGYRVDGQGVIHQFNGNNLGLVGRDGTAAVGRVTTSGTATFTAGTGSGISPTFTGMGTPVSISYTRERTVPGFDLGASLTSIPLISDAASATRTGIINLLTPPAKDTPSGSPFTTQAQFRRANSFESANNGTITFLPGASPDGTRLGTVGTGTGARLYRVSSDGALIRLTPP